MTDIAFEVSRALSMAAFFFFGWACLATSAMKAEFQRYGLARMRKLTGSLEILGALGILVGYFMPLALILGSGGLSLLMFLGVLTRVRIRDSLVMILPALTLMILNGFVFSVAIRGEAL